MGLRDDGRGQSVQVGAILVFAILVILLATYQSTIVPNENKDAEFEHSLDVEQDMLEVRNAIIGADKVGVAAPVSVKLGTTYPRHTFGVNPAPLSGTMQTVDAGTISVTHSDGTPVTDCFASNQTKYLEYEAGYNYLAPKPTLRYENTVLYANYSENRQVIISNQSLVEGGTVNLVALQGTYSENGIGATDFQAQAGSVNTTQSGNYSITFPTRLSRETWERELPSDQIERITQVSENRVQINVTNTPLRCSAVGSDEAPQGGPRSDTGQNGDEINPATKGEVRLVNASVQNSDNNVTAYFNNTGSNPVNATAARAGFYFSDDSSGQNKKVAESINVSDIDGGHLDIASLTIGGNEGKLSDKVTFSPSTPHEISFVVQPSSVKADGDFFVVYLYFEDGTSRQYFIAPQ